MDFTNKTAIVTGGAAGIGFSIAKAFRESGARVVIIDKSESSAPCDMYFHGDIAEENTLIQFAREFADKFGNIDFLINNACLSKKGILSGCG